MSFETTGDPRQFSPISLVASFIDNSGLIYVGDTLT